MYDRLVFDRDRNSASLRSAASPFLQVAKLFCRSARSLVLSCVNVEIRPHAMDRSLGEKYGNIRGT